ncbi:MAG: O-antigen ligase family protein [Vicingaceae bacterium]|nr:O-antigen ligase family protein [Vicingaceae bacterium]
MNLKPLLSHHRKFVILFLMMIVVGLSLSKPLITLGEIGLGAAWLFQGNIKNQILSFFKNRIALILSSIYLLTIIGLFYTTNFEFAIGDVRRKIPLFLLPFLLSGLNPLTQQEIKFIFKVYVIGVVASSLWSVFVLLGGLNETIIDTRQLSRFTSHIRFGLEICLAIFGSIYYALNEIDFKNKIKWLSVGAWLLIFMIFINLFTGILVFSITASILLLFYGVQHKNKMIKITFLCVFITLFASAYCYINNAISNYKTAQQIELLPMSEYSENGEKFYHDTISEVKDFKENGNYIYRNIAFTELEKAWNERSDFNFNGTDLKGQELKTTLLRFITSKGERKTAKAVENLSNEEINAIEKGIANHIYLRMNDFSRRVHKIIWEFDVYNQHGIANGHSVVMRWVYWQNAFRIFKENIFFGVGTGDLQDAFNQEYQTQTVLSEKYYLRAHNQYITYTISFGLIGLGWFLFFLGYPFLKLKRYNNFLYLAFFCIALLSMVTEDTLETQVGVMFFTFFNTILIFNTTNSKMI